ncbi:hypothetical protein ACOMHN_047101 [Nucella lapillus]
MHTMMNDTVIAQRGGSIAPPDPEGKAATGKQGGHVYSWGHGRQGQLGLGSDVISCHPRRLRHSYLEEGASSVACGDAYSAVVTASGRLYMWGRNSHLIEEWMEPRHPVREPQCLNPEPFPPLRHVSCGVRHAVAMGGLPAFLADTKHPPPPSLPSISTPTPTNPPPPSPTTAAAANLQPDSSPAWGGAGPAALVQTFARNGVDLNALSSLAPRESVASRRSKSSAHSVRSRTTTSRTTTSAQLSFPSLGDKERRLSAGQG